MSQQINFQSFAELHGEGGGNVRSINDSRRAKVRDLDAEEFRVDCLNWNIGSCCRLYPALMLGASLGESKNCSTNQVSVEDERWMGRETRELELIGDRSSASTYHWGVVSVCE